MYATYEKAVSFKKYFNPYVFNVFALEVFAPFPVDPFLNVNAYTTSFPFRTVPCYKVISPSGHRNEGTSQTDVELTSWGPEK